MQADLLTFAAHGVFGTTAFSCLTAQNPGAVTAVEAMTPEFVEAQLRAILDWFPVGAIKTGMLYGSPQIEAVVNTLKDYSNIPLVVDPVMVATSGAMLLLPDAVATLTQKLFPMATLITPNLDEAAVLLNGEKVTGNTMEAAARSLAKHCGTAVLLKGGHLNERELRDVFCDKEGRTRTFTHPRIDGVNTHGSGCTLAAAIAANIAKGMQLEAAVSGGLDYLSESLRNPLVLKDEQFIAHLK